MRDRECVRVCVCEREIDRERETTYHWEGGNNEVHYHHWCKIVKNVNSHYQGFSLCWEKICSSILKCADNDNREQT